MGEMIEFARPDGKRAPGYLALPANPRGAAGIVIVEEWWGVTREIKNVADAYARSGYRALVPDLFRGRTAAIGDEANHLVEGLDFDDAARQDVRGAAQYLKQQGGRVGVTGYCIGGALAILTVMHVGEVDAAVSYYGFPQAEAGDPATIKIPLQFHFAKHDEFFTAAGVAKFEERLRAGNVRYEIFWYDAAHGFCNPREAGNYGLGHYNESACKMAWQRTTDFWKRWLA